MSQADLNRAVARATGEPIDRVRQRGFSLLRIRPSARAADTTPPTSSARSDMPDTPA